MLKMLLSVLLEFVVSRFKKSSRDENISNLDLDTYMFNKEINKK